MILSLLSYKFSGDQVVLESSLYKNWIQSLDPSITLKSVTVQSYSPTYIKISTVSERDGLTIPRYIILKPSIACISIFLETPEQVFGIFEQRPLISIGKVCIQCIKLQSECPTAEFIEQYLDSIGIHSSNVSLVNTPSTNTFYPLAGPSTVSAKLFMSKLQGDQNLIQKLNGKEISPGIKLILVPIDEVHEKLSDALSLAAVSYYHK